MRASLFSAALVAALVGFGSTVALVLAAAAALGATPAQAASWVLASSLAKGVGSAGLSLWSRQPMVLAWSTPGAALLAASHGLTMEEAAGAFVLAGLLIAAMGLLRPLGRLVALIPDAVAAGMLAGVLLPFVLRLAPAALESPALVLPMVLAFALLRLRSPAWAVLGALALGLALAFATGAAQAPQVPGLPRLVHVPPAFDAGLALGVAVPLALVTMAGQNLPGFATMRAAGFEPPVGAALATTGLLSAATGLVGAHPTNMAAITAAICLGDDVHPDRAQRWKVGLAYCAVWVALGLLSPLAVAAIAALPPALVAGLVGIALLGPAHRGHRTARDPHRGGRDARRHRLGRRGLGDRGGLLGPPRRPCPPRARPRRGAPPALTAPLPPPQPLSSLGLSMTMWLVIDRTAGTVPSTSVWNAL